MPRKGKRAPVTAPASDQHIDCKNAEATSINRGVQPCKSGYAQAIVSKRQVVLARLNEKISSVGNQYFVGRLGDAAVVMMRNDQQHGAEPEWVLFLSKRAQRDQSPIAETGSADSGGGGAA